MAHKNVFITWTVVRSGVTIYEGLGRKEAGDYAVRHGGQVQKKVVPAVTIDDIAAGLGIPVEQLEREMRGE